MVYLSFTFGLHSGSNAKYISEDSMQGKFLKCKNVLILITISLKYHGHTYVTFIGRSLILNIGLIRILQKYFRNESFS